MIGTVERPMLIPVQDMVTAGSIGAELLPRISDLGGRLRPKTTFGQPFTKHSASREGHLPQLRTYEGALGLSPEMFTFSGERVRGILGKYLTGLLILPQGRLLAAIYGKPQFPAPADRESEIIEGVEDALNKMSYQRAVPVLILRFGLYDGITRSLEEIAKHLNKESPVTRERIRQIQVKGLRNLRNNVPMLRKCLVLPKASLGREVFGAILVADLPELEGKALIKDLPLFSDVLKALATNRRLLSSTSIEDLVMADFSKAEYAHITGQVKDEIASALQRRADEITDKSRREAEQEAKAKVRRLAEIGEPRNNLMAGIELDSEQLERLDEMPLKELGLSTRAYNALKRGDINTVGELLRKNREELLDLRNVGVTIAVEVVEKLTVFLKPQD